MRENIGIYRGKRTDTGEWKEGYLHGVQDRITGKDLFFIIDENNESHRVDPETVGEYTGLTDSTGTGIFEGDIVNVNNALVKGIFLVQYGLAASFICDDGHNRYFLGGCNSTIVGNVYDNPELVGGNDK